MSRGAILGLVGALALVGASWLWLQRREAAVTAVPSTTNGAARGSLETLAARIEPPEETPGSVREEVVLEEELRREPDRAPLRVRVVDRMTEAPVAGARVTLLRVEPRFVRETDEQGWCTLPASEDPWVRVEKEGFLSVEKRFRPVGEQSIPLDPVTTLFGRVLSAETHAPVPGARIALESESSLPEARSGTDGSYELPGIPRGVELRLALEADGFPQDFRIFEIRSDGERDFFCAPGSG